MADCNMGVVERLLDEHGHDPRELLESLVRALDSRVFTDHMEWISGIEDWRYKVNESGELYDSEKLDATDED